jgi:SAM-dependent methyltransferase
VVERYARRDHALDAARYNPLNPAVYLAVQERERALIHLIREARLEPVADKRVLEVGCGAGGNLLQLVKLGFQPANLVANELLEERLRAARTLLPGGVTIVPGDAAALPFDAASFDVVLQSTVFSSLLDEHFQERLAQQMWRWLKPGGGIIWYDFVVNNPRNPDVRGVPLKRVQALFPEGMLRSWRVTLAPPINRAVTRLHPGLYHVFNVVPWLRTHLLCWVGKTR